MGGGVIEFHAGMVSDRLSAVNHISSITEIAICYRHSGARVSANYDVQLHIGESRDSRFSPAGGPGMTRELVRWRSP
jgi:hypothetical protein